MPILSYSQTGGLHIAEHTVEAICELFPTFRRLRMLRNWGGIVDVTPDRSPIIGMTPVPGLFVNCGWGTGGFKATPGSGHVFARDDRTRRAASDRRAILARSVPHRAADRRGRGGRGGALMLLMLAHVRPAAGERIPLRRRGAYRAPGRSRPRCDDEAWAEYLYHAQQSEGHACRALAPHPWLRAVLQRVRDTVSDRFIATYKPGEQPPSR